mmetsp:Transcript_99063/g.275819  ORF Transcript_99063/g.275819 Transcript_99063/m.275819 type:complete len:679 (-) Transcript_99063:129-2165(-)
MECSGQQRVARVAGAAGWALHGLAFELTDGTRRGMFLANDGTSMDLRDDDLLAERGARWVQLEEGEQIIAVEGHHCTAGYLAYDVDLVTNTDRTIHFGNTTQPAWQGNSYRFQAGPNEQIEQVYFSSGVCTGVKCVVVRLGNNQAAIESQPSLVDHPLWPTLCKAKEHSCATREGRQAVVDLCRRAAAEIVANDTNTHEDYLVLLTLVELAGELWGSCGARRHVARVAGAAGWALHGLAFELTDGTRLGVFLENDGTAMDLPGDAGLSRRGGQWVTLEDGEQIVAVKGHHSTAGYLAYDIDLVTNIDRTIHFGNTAQPAWQGGTYQFQAGPDEQIEQVVFSGGFCTGVKCVAARMGQEEQSALVSQLEPVYEAFGCASLRKGRTEARYAWMLAANHGLKHLRCFDQLRSRAIEAFYLPSYWDTSTLADFQVKAGCGLSTDSAADRNLYCRVPLAAEELEVMQGLFDASFRKRYTRDRRGASVPDALRLEHGFRVQNAMNWAEFCLQRAKVEADLDRHRPDVFDNVPDLKTLGVLPNSPVYDLGAASNEAWLFHGTSEKAAELITSGDFLVEKAGSNAGTLFGRGIYMAECCSKADEYSVEGADGLRCMLLCRVTLGSILYCDDEAPDVNRLVQECMTERFHSVLGDREKVHNTFREFIVYNDDQVYPEYVFYYRRIYS